MEKGKTSKQVQCPQCKSFKTQSISVRSRVGLVGVIFIFAGLVWAITIVGLVFTIPFLAIGVPILVVSFFIRETGEMKCKACEYRFNKSSTVEQETIG